MREESRSVDHAGGGLAKDTLVQDGQDTAASTLANFGADGREVVGGRG